MRDEMMAAAHESSPSSGHCLTMNNDFSEGDVMLDVGCVAPSDGGCGHCLQSRPGEGARPMGNAVMEGGGGRCGGGGVIIKSGY